MNETIKTRPSSINPGGHLIPAIIEEGSVTKQQIYS